MFHLFSQFVAINLHFSGKDIFDHLFTESETVLCFNVYMRKIDVLLSFCKRIRHSETLAVHAGALGYELLCAIVQRLLDANHFSAASQAYVDMCDRIDLPDQLRSGIIHAAADASVRAGEYIKAQRLYGVYTVCMARIDHFPDWNGIRKLYKRMEDTEMGACVTDIIRGKRFVDLKQLANVCSTTDFRAFLRSHTAPPPAERDARVDELAAEMQALRLKREAREAELAAENRANEAARRERIRAGRAARAAAQTREPALVTERVRAGPKRSPRAPHDVAEAARGAANREASKAAAADHAKALRDQEAARQAELEARAEYARIGHAIQCG
jgi:hypothetical protein